MKTYCIGNGRTLKLSKNNDQLTLKEKGIQKSATFTPARWASFLLCLDEIDHQLDKLSRGEEVAYRNHHGGGWHVSVTSDFQCVDLRKFYLPFGQTIGIKPTKTGFAFRLSEWSTFKQVIQFVRRDHPDVANFVLCFLDSNHTTLDGIQSCKECNPIPWFFASETNKTDL